MKTLLNKYRYRFAMWLLPKYEKFLLDESMTVHRNLCQCFGSRAVREFLHPENIREIQILRESPELMH